MTLQSVHYVNVFLGGGAIVLQILCLVAIVALLFRPKGNSYLSFIKNNFLPIGFLLSLSAILTSAYYSEVLHYLPCFHCWVDRIFIFPQAIIFLVAWIKRDKNALFYSFWLSILGLLNALYHMYIYYFSEGLAPCDASGVSCVQRLVHEFGGYISIPMLALTGFVALLTVVAVAYFYKREAF